MRSPQVLEREGTVNTEDTADSFNRCDRGLSDLQRNILLLILEKREREGSDLPQHELLSDLAGWRIDRVPELEYRGQRFSRAKIGAGKYNRVHASVSRSVARLEMRDLLTVHIWCFHNRRELSLTTSGLEVARLLASRAPEGVSARILNRQPLGRLLGRPRQNQSN